MLGYVQKSGRRSRETARASVPEDLARRLLPWVDVHEVGADGLWLWLGTILPLLPHPREPTTAASAPDRLREVARYLVDCARERARLTVMGERYYRDNTVLAARVKALEAQLRTALLANGRPSATLDDREAGEAADRYLPR